MKNCVGLDLTMSDRGGMSNNNSAVSAVGLSYGDTNDCRIEGLMLMKSIETHRRGNLQYGASSGVSSSLDCDSKL
ncbi:hypothetical protein TNCV_2859331 [Trichonephila clavipes]|nr:hypothetical protein TNCV_2859331 [Trichonephila clavipes]